MMIDVYYGTGERKVTEMWQTSARAHTHTQAHVHVHAHTYTHIEQALKESSKAGMSFIKHNEKAYNYLQLKSAFPHSQEPHCGGG